MKKFSYTNITAIFTAVVFLKLNVCDGNMNFVRMKCTSENIGYRQFFKVSFNECIEECQRRSRCSAVFYWTRFATCILLDSTVPNGLEDTGTPCIFVNMTAWGRMDIGPCTDHTCLTNEKCITYEADNQVYLCVKSECNTPPELENAFALSNKYETGTRNRYICQPGYSIKNDMSITCTDDATWTNTTATCQKMCHHASLTYFNADLIRVDIENNHAWGTRAHFRCKDGYLTSGEEISSVCTDIGRWDPYHVNCCEMEYYKRSICFTPFEQGMLESKSEMDTHCEQIGAYTGNAWTWVGPILEGTGIKHEFLVSGSTKSSLAKWYNLTKCLEENYGSANALDYIGYTFDQQIQHIREKSLSGKNCWLAFQWMDGEPNGNTNENCVMSQRNESYKLFDTTCNFGPNHSVGFICRPRLPPV